VNPGTLVMWTDHRGIAWLFKTEQIHTSEISHEAASSLPVPGAPYRMTPLGGLMPISS